MIKKIGKKVRVLLIPLIEGEETYVMVMLYVTAITFFAMGLFAPALSLWIKGLF